MTDLSTITVNGSSHDVSAEWRGRRLLDFIRFELGLFGSKEGCGEGDCGACTVLLDGAPICSCLMLCGVAAGHLVTTVEGVAPDHLDRFASACEASGGVQCGFCTPGFAVMTAWLAGGGTETGDETDAKLLEGNICRCTGYHNIVKAILAAHPVMKGQ